MRQFLITVTIWLYIAVSWIVNLIHFIQCDFSAPYKEEFIKGVGVFLAPAAGITVWV